MARNITEALGLILTILGAIALVFGVARVSIPAAFIVGGALAIVAGTLLAYLANRERLT